MVKIHDLLKEKKMSVYRLSKNSGVPYATVNDICNEKADLAKCSAETVWRISRALDVPMEKLLASYLEQREDPGRVGRNFGIGAGAELREKEELRRERELRGEKDLRIEKKRRREEDREQ